MNAKALEALGDELQAPFVAGQLVHPRDRAHVVKVGGTFGLFRAVGLDQHQADDSLLAFGGGLDGRQPRFFVQQQRQRLRRKKRPFGQRQQVERAGQNIGGGDDGVGGRAVGNIVFTHDFRFKSFDFVIGHAVSRG